MANSLLTVSMIVRKAIQLFRNSNSFLQLIDKQYDDQFATGNKIGQSLRIRLPNDYVVRTGATAVPQNTTENQVTLAVATLIGVDTSFSSVDLAMSMQDFAERVLAPMVNVLAGAAAVTIMGGVEGVPNIVHKIVTGTGVTVSPDAATWLAAGGVLDLASAPSGGRCVIMDAMTQARTVATLAGLFNPNETISKQFKSGDISGKVLGFESWAMDQTVILHTEGSFASGAVSATANQSGSTITVVSTTGTLAVGDIITFAGVFAVNRVTKNSTGILQQFVITVAAPAASTSLSIYPPLNPPVAGLPVAYQNVTASPAAGAAIASPVVASETYRKNFAFHPTACTMATADLDLPTGAVVSAARETYDGISLRMIRDYNSTTDQWLSRLDLLFGFLWPRPEWAVIVADSI
jgi:hypothetical protein